MSEISRACGGGDTDRSLVPGALRGYRTWRPVRRRVELRPGMLPISSLSRRGVVWPTQLEAHCTPPDVGSKAFGGSVMPGDHPAPFNGCECGIYAWYDPRDTRILHARVFGVVEASGLVLLGDRGFRAQKARVAAVVTRSRRVAAACTEAGVEVFRSRRQLVKAYPPEDVSALIGPVDEGTDLFGPHDSPGVGDNGGVPGLGGLGLPGAPSTMGLAGGVPVPPSAAAAAAAGQGLAGWRARRRARRLPPPPGMDRKLVMAVWARTAVVAVAVAALPTPVGIISALVAEVALIAIVATRLR
jgi:hypothetical protein